jgi:hypothetical protein
MLFTTPTAVDLTELTFGVGIVPFKKFANLKLRPEVRWDHAGAQVKAFDGGAKSNQFTVAMDVLVTF